MKSVGHGFFCRLLLADMMAELSDDESHEPQESFTVELVEAGSRDCSEVKLSS